MFNCLSLSQIVELQIGSNNQHNQHTAQSALHFSIDIFKFIQIYLLSIYGHGSIAALIAPVSNETS